MRFLILAFYFIGLVYGLPVSKYFFPMSYEFGLGLARVTLFSDFLPVLSNYHARENQDFNNYSRRSYPLTRLSFLRSKLPDNADDFIMRWQLMPTYSNPMRG